MNEPELAMDMPGGRWVSEPVSVAAMQAFVKDVVDYIHTYSSQYATVGSASRKWLSYWAGSALDFYQYHYYDKMEGEYPLDYPYASLSLDKPCIVGEFPTKNTKRTLTPISVNEMSYQLWGFDFRLISSVAVQQCLIQDSGE
jgi:hypothetical protein